MKVPTDYTIGYEKARAVVFSDGLRSRREDKLRRRWVVQLQMVDRQRQHSRAFRELTGPQYDP